MTSFISRNAGDPAWVIRNLLEYKRVLCVPVETRLGEHCLRGRSREGSNRCVVGADERVIERGGEIRAGRQ